MISDIEPQIDQWYYHLDKGQKFTVVAVDEDSGWVEVQNFDGDLEEILFDEWPTLNIELSEAPENWSGPIDIGEVDDLGTEITDTTPDEWSQPLQELRKPDEEKLLKEDEEIGDVLSENELKELSLNNE